MEIEFHQHMQHFCDLERKYNEAQQLIVKFEEQCEALKIRSKAEMSQFRKLYHYPIAGTLD
jgi:hypothetical protein